MKKQFSSLYCSQQRSIKMSMDFSLRAERLVSIIFLKPEKLTDMVKLYVLDLLLEDHRKGLSSSGLRLENFFSKITFGKEEIVIALKELEEKGIIERKPRKVDKEEEKIIFYRLNKGLIITEVSVTISVFSKKPAIE